jgi:hypothetical protein
MSIDAMTAEAGISIATSGKVPPAKAGAVLAELDSLPPASDVIASIDRAERFLWLDAAMALSRGESIKEVEGDRTLSMVSRDLDWNEILRSANRFYDRQIEAMRKPAFEGRRELLAAIEDELLGSAEGTSSVGYKAKLTALRLGGVFSRGALTKEAANALHAYLMPTLGRAVELEDAARMHYDIERLALALAWFHGEHNRWPSDLKEIVPKYLKAIPPDRFSRNPLVYKAREDGYLLYSVGANLKDDGGVRGRRSDDGDIVAGVPHVALPPRDAPDASGPEASPGPLGHGRQAGPAPGPATSPVEAAGTTRPVE